MSQLTGMGIGLYVAREIVRLHGGDITVESKEGEGSTFTVRVPESSAVVLTAQLIDFAVAAQRTARVQLQWLGSRER